MRYLCEWVCATDARKWGGHAEDVYTIALSEGGSRVCSYGGKNKWSDGTLRINKIDVLEVISRSDELRRGWRADRIRQLCRRALDEIPTPPGTPRRPKQPNKAPQRNLPTVFGSSRPISEPPTQPTRLRPQRRASRQAAAPNQISLECRRPRGMAARWLASGAKGTSPQPLPNCRCVWCKHTVIKKAQLRLVHKT